MENVLVVGATGTTGRKVINLLNISKYFEPVAMVRKESQIKEFADEGIKTVLGNLEENVSHSLVNIDKVVFAAGSGGKKVVEVDQEGAKKIIDASVINSVKKFIMLSSMGADQPEKAAELKEYLMAKQNADEYLKTSNVPFVIVRPGSLTNDKGEGTIQIGNSLKKHGSISRDDVAQVLMRSLYDDVFSNQSFEILSGERPIGKALNSLTNL